MPALLYGEFIGSCFGWLGLVPAEWIAELVAAVAEPVATAPILVPWLVPELVAIAVEPAVVAVVLVAAAADWHWLEPAEQPAVPAALVAKLAGFVVAD